MANAIAKRVVLNGSRNYIIHITVVGDGSGEETATILNNTTGDLGTDVKLMKVEASLTGFSADLLWDASTDVVACQLVGDKDVKLKFYGQGGLVNNSGSGKTGDILITTTGLSSGDKGTITLYLKKK